MLPPERRLGRVIQLIDERKYFTLHAGRQTGKTTSLRWLEKHLAAGAEKRVLWVDVQSAREKTDVSSVMTLILHNIDRALQIRHPDLKRPSPDEINAMLQVPEVAVLRYLGRLSALDPRPLVVLFDEADGLVGAAMVSFLTQLRQGYIERAEGPFPSSVALVGQRQVRDYALEEEDRRAVVWLGTTSPFNITSEALTLAPFTEAEVGELLDQHTLETGQRFEPAAVNRIWGLGQGHPWLTNAMADQVVRQEAEDRSVVVTAAHVESAKETLILERRTHIDSLVHRLREPRVRRVIEPMLVGDRATHDTLNDDFAYVLGLGLIRVQDGMYQIANPIYREVIPRALAFDQQMQIATQPAWYILPDGSLDMLKLMVDWQDFWREDGHLAAHGFSYQEAGPHLMLMAFLQRIVNGGGRVEREYGLGRGALDIIVFWKDTRHVIEVKLRRKPTTEERALSQLARYLDQAGLDEGWLVLFDLRETLSWEEKVTLRHASHKGKTIHVVGC